MDGWYNTFRLLSICFFSLAALPTDFFEKYGPRDGLLCLVLRYWLKLNNKQNFCLTGKEFVIGAAVTLTLVDLDLAWYRNLMWIPNARCNSIYNWLQVCYRAVTVVHPDLR